MSFCYNQTKLSIFDKRKYFFNVHHLLEWKVGGVSLSCIPGVSLKSRTLSFSLDCNYVKTRHGSDSRFDHQDGTSPTVRDKSLVPNGQCRQNKIKMSEIKVTFSKNFVS